MCHFFVKYCYTILNVLISTNILMYFIIVFFDFIPYKAYSYKSDRILFTYTIINLQPDNYTVQLGALDATVHTVMAGRFNVRGFPTIKFFGAGDKKIDEAADYDGGIAVHCIHSN